MRSSSIGVKQFKVTRKKCDWRHSQVHLWFSLGLSFA